jgi:hypothetical protein
MESLLQDIYKVMFYHAEKDVEISFREYLDEVGNFSEYSFLEYIKTRKLYPFFEKVKTRESKIYLMMIFAFEHIRDNIGDSGKLLEMELPIGDVQFILFDELFNVTDELLNEPNFMDIAESL